MTTTRRSPIKPLRGTPAPDSTAHLARRTAQGAASTSIGITQPREAEPASGDRPKRGRRNAGSKLAQFVLSASGSAALLAGLGVFVADALGSDPSKILLANIPTEQLRKACRDYQHEMAEHYEHNPLILQADELTEPETYRQWVRDGWRLSRDFLAKAGLALATTTKPDSDNAHSAMLNAVDKCYAAGIDFGASDEYGDYAKGIGRPHR